MSWTLSQIWNDSFEEFASTESTRDRGKRDHLWASELGKAPIDIFLSLNGVPPTNRPDARSHRKFEAGEIWENIIRGILLRSGILINRQEHVTYQYDGLMKVTGKIDFHAGGVVDWDKAKHAAENEFDWLTDRSRLAVRNIISNLSEKYPEGLKEILLEVKSTSGYMFDVYAGRKGAGDNHKMQLFHYLKSKGMDEGHVLYIDRDSVRLAEYGVMNPSYVEDMYKKHIEEITFYYQNNRKPPLETELEFDKDSGRFRVNWKIMYSQYLTLLYGYAHQEEFRLALEPTVAKFNRTLKRIVDGSNMTKLNLECIDDMKKKCGEKYDSYIEIAKVKLVNSTEDE